MEGEISAEFFVTGDEVSRVFTKIKSMLPNEHSELSLQRLKKATGGIDDIKSAARLLAEGGYINFCRETGIITITEEQRQKVY